MQTHNVLCTFGPESWSILNDIERSIKEKVENVGVALRDWDVEVFRGILDNSALNVPSGAFSNVPSVTDSNVPLQTWLL